MLRKPDALGLLTDELRAKFYSALKEADPKYTRSARVIPKRLQHIVFKQCADFSERCAFRRYLMERHELRYDQVVHERDLRQVSTTGKQGAFA